MTATQAQAIRDERITTPRQSAIYFLVGAGTTGIIKESEVAGNDLREGMTLLKAALEVIGVDPSEIVEAAITCKLIAAAEADA